MAEKRKRANITPDGEAIIMARALETPRMQRTKLASKLQGELGELGFDEPEVEVLERKISWYRKHSADDPQEGAWSIATLKHYPLPPGGLAAVLKVWKSREGKGFSIREAKWASLLSVTLQDTNDLSGMASIYARTELMSEILEIPFDTRILDRQLMGMGWTVSAKDGFEGLLPMLAGRDDGVDQIRELQGGSHSMTTARRARRQGDTPSPWLGAPQLAVQRVTSGPRPSPRTGPPADLGRRRRC